MIRRVRSEGDRRRSYVQLCLDDPVVWAAAQAGLDDGCGAADRCRGWCSCAPRTRRARSWRRPGGTRSARSRPPRPAPTPRPGCTPGRRAAGRRHGLQAGPGETRWHRTSAARRRPGGRGLRQRPRGARPRAGTGCTGRSRTRSGSTPTRPSRPPMPTSPAGSSGSPRRSACRSRDRDYHESARLRTAFRRWNRHRTRETLARR